jgi:hypothetical protein
MIEPITDEQIFNHMRKEFEAMFSIEDDEVTEEEDNADE